MHTASSLAVRPLTTPPMLPRRFVPPVKMAVEMHSHRLRTSQLIAINDVSNSTHERIGCAWQTEMDAPMNVPPDEVPNGVEAFAHQLRLMADHLTTGAQDSLSKTAADLAHAAAALLDQVQAQSLLVVKDARADVRRHPLSAAALATGAAALLTFALQGAADDQRALLELQRRSPG
ncbi:MAG: hypothetical protein ABI740_00865 [Alphaproteobacteria bacterium]